MSEYRTYKCDVCGKHEAKRFTFPCVDRESDGGIHQANADLQDGLMEAIRHDRMVRQQ